ncbi:unnamed protein product, partial [marine sediment metagenome]
RPSRLTSLSDQLEAANADVAKLNAGNAQLRRTLSDTDRQVEALVNARAAVTSTLERTKDLIKMNGERIEQSRSTSERDKKEVDQSNGRIAKQSQTLEKMLAELKEAREEHDEAAADLKQKLEKLSGHEEALRILSEALENLRSDFVDLETSYSGFQNELTQLEGGRRADIVRLERLAAERVALEEETKNYEERRAHMTQELHDAEIETSKCTSRFEQLATKHSAIQESLNEARTTCAGLQAEIAARKVQ